MDNNKVTAVVFTGSNQVDYYQKEGKMWVKLNYNNPAVCILQPYYIFPAKDIFANNLPLVQ